jgi:hypothetical protein
MGQGPVAIVGRKNAMPATGDVLAALNPFLAD